MKPALLDANVLIALLWPAHEHHDSARRWLRGRRTKRWATCPLTQLAFVRIVSNPAFSADALTPGAAALLLEKNLKHPDHLFWPDDIDVAGAVSTTPNLTGHKQVSDVYLLALARAHGGLLATFDTGLRAAVAKELAAAVETVAPPS